MADEDLEGIRFVIADKDDHYVLELSGVDSSFDLVDNGVPTALFRLDDDDPALPDVWAAGSRAWVYFRGVEQFRGRIKEVPREAGDDEEAGGVEVLVEGDAVQVWDILGWPNAATATTVGVEFTRASEYAKHSGTTEAVVKAALTANFTRLGIPWSCAPNEGRGLTGQKVALRFEPLADQLIPLLTAAGLSLVIEYVTDPVTEDVEVVVDVREPETVPGVFTVESGVPDAFAFNRIAPNVTRVVVGGAGTGTEQVFVRLVDSTREAAWGFVKEVYVSASDTDEGVDISQDGLDAIREGAEKRTLSTDLVESDAFRFLDSFHLGDLVTVQWGPLEGDFPIAGVTVADDSEDGVLVTPTVGSLEATIDTTVRLARLIARMRALSRKQMTRKGL